MYLDLGGTHYQGAVVAINGTHKALCYQQQKLRRNAEVLAPVNILQYCLHPPGGYLQQICIVQVVVLLVQCLTLHYIIGAGRTLLSYPDPCQCPAYLRVPFPEPGTLS